ncbi:hypothetical protein NCCP133_21920 [Cytobacillus sp. NCCP-133]|nr:hypothetical protein NCCP133_21920 [Cytobacillus sp. NCCP-133]
MNLANKLLKLTNKYRNSANKSLKLANKLGKPANKLLNLANKSFLETNSKIRIFGVNSCTGRWSSCKPD